MCVCVGGGGGGLTTFVPAQVFLFKNFHFAVRKGRLFSEEIFYVFECCVGKESC